MAWPVLYIQCWQNVLKSTVLSVLLFHGDPGCHLVEKRELSAAVSGFSCLTHISSSLSFSKVLISLSFCKRLPSHTGQEQLALGSPSCSFVRHHTENGPIHRKMVVHCPQVITFKVKPFSRPDKTKKKEWMAQPVFCIVDSGFCYFTLCLGSPLRKSNNIFWPNSATWTKCYFI